MTPDDYCYNLAAPPGSDFRYSLLGLPLARRQALIAVKAFELEVTQIVDQCQDSSVGRAKLDWWRDEIGRLFVGKPQHPVTVALQPHVSAFNLPEEYFREIADGAAMDVDDGAYPSFSELSLYAHRRGSIPALLAAEILNYRNRRGTPRFAHDAGTMLLLLEFLYEVRRYAQLGRVYLPEDEMQRYDVRPSDLLAAQTPERLRRLFAAQAERIRDAHQRALRQLPDEDRYAQYPVLIRLELALALLAEIAEDGYRLLERRIQLTPVRKLWLAWRLRRREKQHYHPAKVTE